MLYAFRSRRHRVSVRAVLPEPTGLSVSDQTKVRELGGVTHPPIPMVNPRSSKFLEWRLGISRSAYFPGLLEGWRRDRRGSLAKYLDYPNAHGCGHDRQGRVYVRRFRGHDYAEVRRRRIGYL